MATNRVTPDANFYWQKAASYRAKARAATNVQLRAAMEAAACEYELRARERIATGLKAGKVKPLRFVHG